MKTGCQWRLLPHDYPKWSTVKSFYCHAVTNGTWEKVMGFLVKETRVNAGRNVDPSYTLIDSQSVKTTADADNRGYFEVLPKRWRVERTFLLFLG